MIIPTRIRTLVPAALLALTIAGVSVGQADAKPRHSADNGVRCSLLGYVVGLSEDLQFFMPGQAIEIRDSQGNSHIIRCGADGNWVVVSGPTLGGTLRPIAPLAGGAAAQPK